MQAQVILSEDFTGGTSTTGFTINQLIATTTWTYNNPGARAITGADFDGDFAIFDSDIAGSGAGNASAELVSAPFDASGASNLLLNFSHHFRWCCGAVATVQVWDGTNWNTVLTLNSIADNMGSTATPAVDQVHQHHRRGRWLFHRASEVRVRRRLGLLVGLGQHHRGGRGLPLSE
jgi:hypothetical protein